MARTQAKDFDDKRQAIMKQAVSLFANKGFNGTAISDLSKACSVSKSLIYHYYDAKEDILFDIMREHIDELLETVLINSQKHNVPSENFKYLTRAVLQCYTGAANAQKVLLYELGQLSSNQQSEIRKKQRKIISIFEACLSECQPNLKTQPERLRAQIMLFFGMINWTPNWFNEKGALNLTELSDLASSIITN